MPPIRSILEDFDEKSSKKMIFFSESAIFGCQKSKNPKRICGYFPHPKNGFRRFFDVFESVNGLEEFPFFKVSYRSGNT